MSAPQAIRLQVDGRVATVTLARADKLNALSRDMVDQLTEAVEGLVADPEVRCLVLAAEGRMFSAGADIEEFQGDFGRGQVDAAATEAEARLGARLCAALESPELVTIAAVRTAAIGGAAALVAACDLRVLGEGARIVIPELAMGFPLAWGGIERFVRDLGPSVVRDLVLTGRPLSAAEALDRGFACAVVPADEVDSRALRTATAIAARPAFGTSAALRRILAVSDHSRADGIDDDAATLARAATDPEAMAAARAYLASLSS